MFLIIVGGHVIVCERRSGFVDVYIASVHKGEEHPLLRVTDRRRGNDFFGIKGSENIDCSFQYSLHIIHDGAFSPQDTSENAGGRLEASIRGQFSDKAPPWVGEIPTALMNYRIPR